MYNVYRGGLKVGSPTANSFSDIGLTPSTTYSYSVHLEDNAGNEGTASNIIAPTTSADVLIHVVNIKMVIKTSVFNTYATVTVKIVDANNNPVSGGNSHRQMVKRDPR